ncbi:hypothetical protein OF83DRAFT_1174334 [Amylostereum chailletii]|nr:hypothetical protein OF83DRAFT_1174334 [Amylostereum chailletii]
MFNLPDDELLDEGEGVTGGNPAEDNLHHAAPPVLPFLPSPITFMKSTGKADVRDSSSHESCIPDGAFASSASEPYSLFPMDSTRPHRLLGSSRRSPPLERLLWKSKFIRLLLMSSHHRLPTRRRRQTFVTHPATSSSIPTPSIHRFLPQNHHLLMARTPVLLPLSILEPLVITEEPVEISAFDGLI